MLEVRRIMTGLESFYELSYSIERDNLVWI